MDAKATTQHNIISPIKIQSYNQHGFAVFEKEGKLGVIDKLEDIRIEPNYIEIDLSRDCLTYICHDGWDVYHFEFDPITGDLQEKPEMDKYCVKSKTISADTVNPKNNDELTDDYIELSKDYHELTSEIRKTVEHLELCVNTLNDRKFSVVMYYERTSKGRCKMSVHAHPKPEMEATLSVRDHTIKLEI